MDGLLPSTVSGSNTSRRAGAAIGQAARRSASMRGPCSAPSRGCARRSLLMAWSDSVVRPASQLTRIPVTSAREVTGRSRFIWRYMQRRLYRHGPDPRSPRGRRTAYALVAPRRDSIDRDHSLPSIFGLIAPINSREASARLEPQSPKELILMNTHNWAVIGATIRAVLLLVGC